MALLLLSFGGWYRLRDGDMGHLWLNPSQHHSGFDVMFIGVWITGLRTQVRLLGLTSWPILKEEERRMVNNSFSSIFNCHNHIAL